MAKIIGVDFDDVLVSFNEALCIWHNYNFGTSYQKKDVISYDFENIWLCSREEALARIFRFYSSTEHANILPVTGAVDALHFLADDEVYIITARSEIAKEVTEWLLEKYFPKLIGRIHYEKDKAIACKRLGVEIFVDDSLAHATKISEVGVPVLLFNNPWNQTNELPHNVKRVYSWVQILKHLR